MSSLLQKALMIGVVAAAHLPVASHAGVVIAGTRVIYNEDAPEATALLINRNAHPVLVQAWIDDGDASVAPEDVSVPFVMLPPIFRMEPEKRQVLRMTRTDEVLRSDQESLYWLNTLEVPPKPEKGDAADATGHLQFALRTRIKLIYRPSGLASGVEDARSALKATVVQESAKWGVRIENPTPYYMNFSTIAINVDGKEQGDDSGMVTPRSTAFFPIDAYTGSGKGTPALSLIADDGRVIPLAVK